MPVSAAQNALVQKYCYLAADRPVNPLDGESAPLLGTADLMKEHKVEFLLDGTDFFQRMAQELRSLRTQGARNPYFYGCFWGLNTVFYNEEIELNGQSDIEDAIPWKKRAGAFVKYGVKAPGSFKLKSKGDDRYFFYYYNGGREFTDVYKEIKDAYDDGVEVKLMGWVSLINLKMDYHAVPKYGADIAAKIPHRDYNLQTAYNVRYMRKEIGENNVFLNILAHPIGGCHCKFFVVGTDDYMRACVGGIDPLGGREFSPKKLRNKGWHDIAAMVEGEAAKGVYDHFRNQWNELATRIDPVKIHFYPQDTGSRWSKKVTSHKKDPQLQIPDRAKKNPTGGGTNEYFVQVIRTLPQMNFATDWTAARIQGFLNQASAKAQNKAKPVMVQVANNEDMLNLVMRRLLKFSNEPLTFAPRGLFEFKQVAKKAIENADDYIFWVDQCFWSEEIFEWIFDRMVARPNLKVICLTGDAMSAFTAHSMNVAMTGKVFNHQNLAFWGWNRMIVHPKCILIDDKWTFIGSQNMARRSLYTDFELGLTITHETEVENWRKRLWEYYLNMRNRDQAPLPAPGNLQQALGLWNPNWGTAPAQLPAEFARSPFPANDALVKEHDVLEGVGQDGDSRDEW